MIGVLYISLNLVMYPRNLYEDIESGRSPRVFFPYASGDKTSSEFSVNPNYFFTDFSFPVGGWWKVFYEPETFYIVDDIPHFLSATLHFERDPVVFHLELFSGREYMALRRWPNTSFFYIPTPPHISFDSRFPYVSYILFKFGNQEISLGRDKIRWGYWRHPVALSGRFPYLDNFSYSASFGNFGYAFTIASINPVLSKDEWKVQSSVIPVNADPLSPYCEKSKNLVAHRLEFHPVESLRISIGELTMVGGKSLDLFSIDPLSILHNNFNEGYTNSMLDSSLSWTFLRGWNYYIEFALDDFAVPLTERADVKPTAYGLTTGFVKTLDLLGNRGYIELSYTKTTKWMYNTFLPYLKFNSRYVFLSNFPVGSRAIVDYPLGFEYGPDAQMFSVYAKISGRLSLESELSLLLKGPTTIETEYKGEVFGKEKRYLMYTLRMSIENGANIFIRLVNDRYLIGGWWEISRQF